MTTWTIPQPSSGHWRLLLKSLGTLEGVCKNKYVLEPARAFAALADASCGTSVARLAASTSVLESRGSVRTHGQ